MPPTNEKTFSSIGKLLRKTNDPSIIDGAPACERRALLVGISYQGLDSNIISHLHGTETDVLRVAKMLETQGYDLENIRVLANGYSDYHVPTKENILKGLSWLVKHCRPNDFRTFFFAGHGFDDTQSIEDGDIYRKVYDKNRPLQKSETRQEALSRERELTYSREAIAPQDVRWLNPPQDSDASSGSETEYLSADEDKPSCTIATAKSIRRRSATGPQVRVRGLATPKGLKIDLNRLIFDTEINNALSGLPENSTLTCIFDCCHSGRMLSLPLKARGGGYRSGSLDSLLVTGFRNMSMASPDDNRTPITIGNDAGENVQNPTSVRANIVNNLGLSHGLCMVKTTAKGPPNKTVVHVQHGTVYPAKGQVEPDQGQSSPLLHRDSRARPGERNDVDGDQLPDIERQANKIKARVLCWSGSHQRQNSQEIVGPKQGTSYGLFTKAFCDAVQLGCPVAPEPRLPVTNRVVSSDQKQTYGQIFTSVDAWIENQLELLNQSLQTTIPKAPNIEQFPQLWSTHKLDDYLNSQFMI